MPNPLLRFKNVDHCYEDWQKILVSDLGSFRRGQTYKSDQILDDKSGVMIVRSSNLVDGWFVNHTNDAQYVNIAVSPEDCLQKHDVVICTANGSTNLVGKSSIYDGSHKGLISWGAFCTVFRPTRPLAEYFFRTSTYRRLIKSLKQGGNGALANLNVKLLDKETIFFPSNKAEALKMSSLFEVIDKKIALAERKLKMFYALESGMRNKLLNRELRFSKSDQNQWIKCQISDYFVVRMCKRILKEQTHESGDIPFYKIGTFGKQADSYISKELFDSYRKKYNYPNNGDTLISCSGTVGRCVVFDGHPAYFQDSNIVWLEAKDKTFAYNKKFLNILLKNMKWDELSSSTIARIYSSDLLDKSIVLPPIDEQNKIANFFETIEQKMICCKKQIDTLKMLKRALLQQMFV